MPLKHNEIKMSINEITVSYPDLILDQVKDTVQFSYWAFRQQNIKGGKLNIIFNTSKQQFSKTTFVKLIAYIRSYLSDDIISHLSIKFAKYDDAKYMNQLRDIIEPALNLQNETNKFSFEYFENK